MSEDEQPLLGGQPVGEEATKGGLTVLEATLSFINLCGVLPIITLARPIIDCGEYSKNLTIPEIEFTCAHKAKGMLHNELCGIHRSSNIIKVIKYWRWRDSVVTNNHGRHASPTSER